MSHCKTEIQFGLRHPHAFSERRVLSDGQTPPHDAERSQISGPATPGENIQCRLLLCPGKFRCLYLVYSLQQSCHDQVYECMVRGIAVMRRRADSYVNATQILKVAGVDKGRRTKILEREVVPGKHEVVQGGYGKYQGTW
jgi:hypothetical protein